MVQREERLRLHQQVRGPGGGGGSTRTPPHAHRHRGERGLGAGVACARARQASDPRRSTLLGAGRALLPPVTLLGDAWQEKLVMCPASIPGALTLRFLLGWLLSALILASTLLSQGI